MLESLNGNRRVSIQETAEGEPATPINNKKRRLDKIHVTPSSITSPSFVCNSSSLKNHTIPSSTEPNARHINHVLGRRTPSSIEPKSHAKNNVTPSSAVNLPSLFSPTPCNPASQKNHVTPLSIKPKVRSSQGTTTSLKNHFTPSSGVTMSAFVTSSQTNHFTPAYVKLEAQQIMLKTTTFSQKSHVTSLPKAHSSLDSTMTPVLTRRSRGGESKRQQHSLTTLAQRFHQIVVVSKQISCQFARLLIFRSRFPSIDLWQ
jgi:hypothetical protein